MFHRSIAVGRCLDVDALMAGAYTSPKHVGVVDAYGFCVALWALDECRVINDKGFLCVDHFAALRVDKCCNDAQLALVLYERIVAYVKDVGVLVVVRVVDR